MKRPKKEKSSISSPGASCNPQRISPFSLAAAASSSLPVLSSERPGRALTDISEPRAQFLYRSAEEETSILRTGEIPVRK